MRLKNVSDVPVELPTLGLKVGVGDEVDVTGDAAQNLLASGQFERTDKPSKSSEKE